MAIVYVIDFIEIPHCLLLVIEMLILNIDLNSKYFLNSSMNYNNLPTDYFGLSM